LRFRFRTKTLQALYDEKKGAAEYPQGVVVAFFKALHIIESACDERDLYAFKRLHFEELQGSRRKQGQHSIRLNDQYRLILTVEQDQEGKYVLIISLEKHYR